MTQQSVIVIGAGVAGLTAAALLAHEGIKVTMLEAHAKPGGCAGTFRRGAYIFDVGATQVAGLEKGGIHYRILKHLKSPIPSATILDPACVVHLGDGKEPIYIWYDAEKWKKERNEKFPGSEPFWDLCHRLHKSNWAFAQSDPILPVKNFWDFRQFLQAIKSIDPLSALFSRSSVADLLRLCSCTQDLRLRKFLDLQLKLYSQESTEKTAALYGATVLQMAQAPLGLRHLDGSMQELSDHLLSSFLRDGGNFYSKHRVLHFKKTKRSIWQLDVLNHKNLPVQFEASDLIFSIPPQSLLNMITSKTNFPEGYRARIESLSQPKGAIVFYGAISRDDLPSDCLGHIQFNEKTIGSLFVSISNDGDGRAPKGQATVIASAFTDVESWNTYEHDDYQMKKNIALQKIVEVLNTELGIDLDSWLHKELATPKSFARWTARPKGIVGGLGQTPANFGPFGLSSRTPMKGLWLCGDSIYPGEGTAGVSISALMVCRQLMSNHGRQFNLNQSF